MTTYLDLDFETFSTADLKKVGARAYAEHPTTAVLCLVYGKEVWRPGDDTEPLRRLAANRDVMFVAHNAAFEQAIWREIMVPEFGMPSLPPERWEDTMATCAWKALPLGLDRAARAVKLYEDKDPEGHRLTIGLSHLNKKTNFYPPQTALVLDRVTRYCRQDVVVETSLREEIGLLSKQSPQERSVWLLDQKINERGIRIDLDFVSAAQEVVDRATGPLLQEFQDLTSGVQPGQIAKVIEWARANGTDLESLRKEYLSDLLDDDDADDSNAREDDVDVPRATALDPAVRRMLEIRQMLGSASVKKLAAMRACVCADGRARGLLQYHAASTGRWGGRLLQPHNFPRGNLKVTPDEAVDAIMSRDPAHVERVLGRPAIECVGSSLRHALVADPGRVFLVGDFAGIEARVVLALAGQYDKTELMSAGHDVYLDMASAIFDELVTKGDLRRQFGKNGVLGCGFQCGPANFNAKFLKGRDLDLATRTVQAYRHDWAPRVPRLWYGLERAALEAATNGKSESYGVTYEHRGKWLTATLPSGWQKIWYHLPRLFRDEKFDKPAWRYTAYKGGKVSQVKAYGGLLTENVVQGLARGILCGAMARLEKAGYPIVLTVHDEIVVETRDMDEKRFRSLMTQPSEWVDRLRIPLAAETWVGSRYKK